MKIKGVTAVYFSAVGHTKEITIRLAEELSSAIGIPCAQDDFTLPAEREEKRVFDTQTLVVFGMPTYAGRIPNKILPFVQSLFRGRHTPAVPVVTFGNRAYDEALKELYLTLSSQGFLPVGAGAFVTPHVMSDVMGAGRPDEEDDRMLMRLSALLAERLKKAEAQADTTELFSYPFADQTVAPYYIPLEADGVTKADFLKAKPKTHPAACDRCGICAKVCPMGSIDPDDITQTPGICIKCQACIRKCPTGAKFFDDPSLLSHIRMLETNYLRPGESVIF